MKVPLISLTLYTYMFSALYTYTFSYIFSVKATNKSHKA